MLMLLDSPAIAITLISSNSGENHFPVEPRQAAMTLKAGSLPRLAYRAGV
jgi:hypothetical protein